MYEFQYDPYNKIVYMTIGAGKTISCKDNGEIVESNELPFEVAKNLKPLAESKKMKENNWESRYCWELPYGESHEFIEWLKANFNGSRLHFYVKPYVGAPIRIFHHYTRNEVGEPFFDCEACLSKNVLRQVCEVILYYWCRNFSEDAE